MVHAKNRSDDLSRNKTLWPFFAVLPCELHSFRTGTVSSAFRLPDAIAWYKDSPNKVGAAQIFFNRPSNPFNCLVADAAKRDAVTEETKRLEGDWDVVALEEHGERWPPTTYELKVSVGRDRFVMNGWRRVAILYWKGELRETYTMDPTKNPKAIDFTVASAISPNGRQEKRTLQGIYTLQGDTLKICVNMSPIQTRPLDFTTRTQFASTDTTVFTLRRAKSGSERPP
jgi:uncharacterized protein (TIGR03067 family)